MWCAVPMLLPYSRQSAGFPAVQWPYQSPSLLGLTNNTFFNFIVGNSVLIISTGHSFNPHPISSSGAYLHTSPFILQTIFHVSITEPISGEFKGLLSWLASKYVTTWN